MTPLIIPHIWTNEEEHDLDLWTRDQCYRFYVAQRRKACTFVQRMDLWLRAPYCEECILSEPVPHHDPPDITPNNWQDDVAWKLGEDTLAGLVLELKDDHDFTLRCKRCHRQLAPWNGDVVYVVSYHLEEHYAIPMYTPGHKNPPRRLREQIFGLYGRRCFACGSHGPRLHIDHILPQSHRGDAAFRNLQPLCERCGQEKGDSLPEEVNVWSNLYFTREPPCGYEGLFW